MDGVMETGWRYYGAAKLRIRQSMALPYPMRGRTREICALECAPEMRGKGHAALLMNQVCKEADAAKIVLVLWPAPWGDNPSLTVDELREWYERRFGFVVTQPNPVLMARAIGARGRTLKLNTTMEALHAEQQRH